MKMEALNLPSQPTRTALIQQRYDGRRSEIVNKGIAVQTCFSTLCAIEFLKCNNITSDIIERVLLHPDLRRKLPQ
jgi:hypothetical protein